MNKFTLKLGLHQLVVAMVIIGFSAGIAPIATASDIDATTLFEEVNKVRDEHNLPTLQNNPLLVESAIHKAVKLFEEQVFAHTYNVNPFYEEIDDAGYHYKSVGENLAIDFDTSKEVMEGWMNSPLHKENILNEDFSEMGIEVKEGVMNGVKTTLVVQHFGEPKDTFIADTSKAALNQITQPQNLTLAAFIATSASVEAGTLITYAFYQITRRKKRE